jgi:hypothetical protein
MAYTYEKLDSLTKTKLERLSRYLKVPDVNMKMLKGDMIEAILEYTQPKNEVADGGLPPASVRIQRIRESQE